MSLWLGPFQNGHVHFLSGKRLRRLGWNEKKLHWKVGARFDRTDHCDRKHASHGEHQDDCKGHFVSSVSTSPAMPLLLLLHSRNFNSHIGRVLAKMMPMENLFTCVLPIDSGNPCLNLSMGLSSMLPLLPYLVFQPLAQLICKSCQVVVVERLKGTNLWKRIWISSKNSEIR